jgi:GrpB-like predicted nucleotidyltransferase (UPF0157 family)
MPEPVIGPYLFHPPTCTEYDPRAAEVARRIEALITAYLPTVTVEHIGSTAVPGCAGKGVVDLMVLYPQEQLEAVKEVLSAQGFQRQTVGHLFPESRPMRVGTLRHRGRIFRLHVHVIAAGSAEVAQLRAFRDYLCADPGLRAAYGVRKREILSAGITDPADYTGIKSLFVQQVLTGARPCASAAEATPSSARNTTRLSRNMLAALFPSS